MQLLAATDVPVPRMLLVRARGPQRAGRAFYVMAQVRGRVPTDQPPYHAGGWMTEASPAERAAIWWGGIETLAKIHRLDWRALGFGFLERPELGATPLDRQLAYYARYLAWARARRAAADGRGRARLAREARAVRTSRRACRGATRASATSSSTAPRPAAVLDWEMVTLGSPETDLAWSIFLDRHHSEGLESPRLAGFPCYEDSVARYEALTGHRVRHLHYYQVFAGFRFAVIMSCASRSRSCTTG